MSKLREQVAEVMEIQHLEGLASALIVPAFVDFDQGATFVELCCVQWALGLVVELCDLGEGVHVMQPVT